jgi:DNA polymerase-3 subunit gamma/tau
VINEAEINFKMARNKRLHVEMLLIKLNFLQQAISLSMHEGQVLKKKRVDAPIAIRYKGVEQIQKVVPNNAFVNKGGKLEIEEKKPNINVSTSATIQPAILEKVVTQPQTSSKPVDVVQVVSPNIIPQQKPVSKFSNEANRKSVLDLLRNKYGDSYTIQEVKDPIPLEEHSLNEHWEHFASKIKEEGKISQANAFTQSTLEIIDDSNFVIHVDSSLQEKFIEQEKMFLLEYLQRHYCNKQIDFTYLLRQTERKDLPLSITLNSKQKFERIAERYPLLKVLRDNLRMEIEF